MSTSSTCARASAPIRASGRSSCTRAPGFGGSCFPKDLRALIHTADEQKQACDILKAAVDVNARQRRVLAEKIIKHFNGDLKGRTIALWGLAFKANTDDMREASSLAVIEELTKAGARVVAYDPVAMPNAREQLAGNALVTLAPTARDAAEGADALAVITEWLEFRSPDFEWLARTLAGRRCSMGATCTSRRRCARRDRLLRHRPRLTAEVLRSIALAPDAIQLIKRHAPPGNVGLCPRSFPDVDDGTVFERAEFGPRREETAPWGRGQSRRWITAVPALMMKGAWLSALSV